MSRLHQLTGNVRGVYNHHRDVNVCAWCASGKQASYVSLRRRERERYSSTLALNTAHIPSKQRTIFLTTHQLLNFPRSLAAMICSSCRHSLAKRLCTTHLRPVTSLSSTITSNTRRSLSTTTASTPPPSTQASSSATPDAKTGTSQPFSSPFFPQDRSNAAFLPTSAEAAAAAATATVTPAAAPSITLPSNSRKPSSSVPGGQSLAALSYLKNPTAPLLAKEDSDYPSWLWTLLDASPASTSLTTNAANSAEIVPEDIAKLSKKARAKHERKMARLRDGIEAPVPVHEQSKDLTVEGEGAVESLERRMEVTRSARAARRKELRQANFLRTM